MNYKTGDMVFIKPYELMVKQYGKDKKTGHCVVNGYSFTKKVEKSLKGKNRIAKIKICHGRCYTVQLHGEPEPWGYGLTDKMIAGYAFEYGEKLEVSDNKKDWTVQEFIGFVPGCNFPYATSHTVRGVIRTETWRYARPISKEPEIEIPVIEITVKVDGKDVKFLPC